MERTMEKGVKEGEEEADIKKTSLCFSLGCKRGLGW
jgi:hypothetical protein